MVVPGLGALDADVWLALDGDPLDCQLRTEDRGKPGGSIPRERISSILDALDVRDEVQRADTHQRVEFNLVVGVGVFEPGHPFGFGLNCSPRGRVLQPDPKDARNRDLSRSRTPFGLPRLTLDDAAARSQLECGRS